MPLQSCWLYLGWASRPWTVNREPALQTGGVDFKRHTLSTLRKMNSADGKASGQPGDSLIKATAGVRKADPWPALDWALWWRSAGGQHAQNIYATNTHTFSQTTMYYLLGTSGPTASTAFYKPYKRCHFPWFFQANGIYLHHKHENRRT